VSGFLRHGVDWTDNNTLLSATPCRELTEDTIKPAYTILPVGCMARATNS